jgi:hypothetical protein
MWLLFLGFLALGVLSLRGMRWAYVAFVTLGLLYFPAKAGFQLNPRPCQLTFDTPLAIHSLTNYGHIVLFAVFFIMSSAQFRMSNWSPLAWAGLAAIVMGALVELAQGVTGAGNCRLRDLIPDAVGILIGATIVWLLIKRGWRPQPTWALGWRRDVA